MNGFLNLRYQLVGLSGECRRVDVVHNIDDMTETLTNAIVVIGDIVDDLVTVVCDNGLLNTRGNGERVLLDGVPRFETCYDIRQFILGGKPLGEPRPRSQLRRMRAEVLTQLRKCMLGSRPLPLRISTCSGLTSTWRVSRRHRCC